MNVFTQLVYVIGKLTPDHVQMLGTGFLVRHDGYVVTTYHIVGSDPSKLVVLAPHTGDMSEYQDLSDTSCKPIPATVEEIDPIRDLAIVKIDIAFSGEMPQLGSFDDDSVGDAVGIFGFPHCTEGRRALTFQRTEIGAKVLLEESGVKSKHAVINTQTRPGQSGSLVFSIKKGSVSGVVIGAWAPKGPGIVLGGIDPRALHQTTHCVSAEYVRDMV